jgi:hypothetical protein
LVLAGQEVLEIPPMVASLSSALSLASVVVVVSLLLVVRVVVSLVRLRTPQAVQVSQEWATQVAVLQQAQAQETNRVQVVVVLAQ